MANEMPKIKVLVADDMTTMRNIVKQTISQSFFNVTVKEAINGNDAKAKLKAEVFDMVISDWEMPNFTGIELLKWVRSHPKMKNIPFIMLTANSEKNGVVQAMSLGCNAYIIKPFTPEKLTVKMIELLDKLNRRQHERISANNSVTISSQGNYEITGPL